ncbi:MAG TPA: hypothetical protein VKH42_18765 [Vicinamibacterales bacterium]|nr:hypothetical protein [Vicinamibacterales bacterium]
MRLDTLDILRCPYCGGRLELVESLFHRCGAASIEDGILGCHCCIFPVVDGIPVMHLQTAATDARDLMQAGQPELARRKMFGLESDAEAAAFDAVASSATATYRETVDALGPNFEGGYFLYRFSDPTFIVAEAVVRAVAGTVLARDGRAIDICGGSGHLTRTLVALSQAPPILADLYYAKIWLARRFTAPGCEPVCCDGNAPFPFAKGAFRFAMCTDAFMYIWTKRQFVAEMSRLIDCVTGAPGTGDGAVLIGHTHNERTWTPSHGQPLAPEGYADLFEWIEPRIFAEGNLFEDVVAGGPLDLTRHDDAATLDASPALTIVATRHRGVFTKHAIAAQPLAGELRINPLYAQEPADGNRVRLRLRFPGEDYEQEYGACRRYLPDEQTIDCAAVDALPSLSARAARGPLPPATAELVRRRVLLDLPRRYY